MTEEILSQHHRFKFLKCEATVWIPTRDWVRPSANIEDAGGGPATSWTRTIEPGGPANTIFDVDYVVVRIEAPNPLAIELAPPDDERPEWRRQHDTRQQFEAFAADNADVLVGAFDYWKKVIRWVAGPLTSVSPAANTGGIDAAWRQ